MKLRYRDTHEYVFKEYNSIYLELTDGGYLNIEEHSVEYISTGKPHIWMSLRPLEKIGELLSEIKFTDIFQMYIGFKGELFDGYFFHLSFTRRQVKNIYLGQSRLDLHPPAESSNEPEAMARADPELRS